MRGHELITIQRCLIGSCNNGDNYSVTSDIFAKKTKTLWLAETNSHRNKTDEKFRDPAWRDIP
jgi:hypothetical protein